MAVQSEVTVGVIPPELRRYRLAAQPRKLIEADDATSDPDFLSKMGIALRQVKVSRAALIKLRLGNLDHFRCTAERELESEATQLAAIFATIILNMRLRLEQEAKTGKKGRKL